MMDKRLCAFPRTEASAPHRRNSSNRKIDIAAVLCAAGGVDFGGQNQMQAMMPTQSLLRWKAVTLGLLPVVAVTACIAATRPQAADGLEPSSCARSPTARCVIELSLAATTAIGKADRRAEAFTRIAKAQAIAGEDAAARLNLAHALTAADAIDQTVFADEQWMKGLPEDEADHARATALADIARILVILGEAAQAQATFLRAIAIAEAIDGSRHRAQSLVAIATAQLAAGVLDAARKTLSRVDLANNVHYLPGFHRIVWMQGEAGDLEGALLTAQRIPKDIERAWALAGVAGVQASTGDAARALTTAESIEHSYFRMLAMHHIGASRAEVGDIEGAWGAVGAVEEIWQHDREEQAGPRDVIILQDSIVGAIVDAHLVAGVIEAAIAAAEKMVDGSAFVEAQANIVKAQLAVGDFAAARTTAEEAVCGGHHFADRCVEVLAGIAVVQASAGRSVDANGSLSMARAIAERIYYDRARVRAFVALHAARIRMDDAESARRAFAIAVAAADAFGNAQDRAERLTGMGIGAARNADAESAALAFTVAQAATAEVEHVDERVRAFVHIGLVRTKLGDGPGARRAFSRAVADAVAIEAADRRAMLLADVAFALAAGRLP